MPLTDPSIPPVPTIPAGLIGKNESRNLLQQNKLFEAVLSPSSNSILTWLGGRKPVEQIPGINKTRSSNDDQIALFKLNSISDLRHSFISNTAFIFVFVHEQTSPTEDYDGMTERRNISTNELLQYSSMYLKEIKTTRDMCREATVNHPDAEEQYFLFCQMHAIWQMMQIVFLSENTDSVADLLVDWLLENHPDDYDESEDSQDDIESFWSRIKRLILRGKFQRAATLLSRSNQIQVSQNDSIYLKLLRLLETRPAIVKSRQQEFSLQLNAWKQQIPSFNDLQRLASQTQSSSDKAHLSAIFGLLSGDEATIIRESKSWMEALVGLIVLSIQSSALGGRGGFGFGYGVGDLGILFDMVENQFPEDDTDHEDLALRALVKREYEMAIFHSHYIDQWLVTHLSDFTVLIDTIQNGTPRYPHLSQMIEDHEEDGVVSADIMRVLEHYKLEYAISLVSHKSLWRLGFDYLGYCKGGRRCIEEVILRIPLQNELKFKKILSYAQSYGFIEQCKTLYRIRASRAMKQNQYAEAIRNYLLAEEPYYVSKVCDVLGDMYIQTGDIQYLEIVEEFGTSEIKKNDRLTFLYQYLMFTRSYKDPSAQRKAASQLIRLLSSTIVPDRFLATLLFDSLPLLESSNPVFTTEDTHEIMRCLEEISLSHCKEWYMKGTGVDSEAEFEQRLEVVKLAVVRACARVYVG
ncbi:Nup85 nucleoporin-domain-containing protein [Paraphysoderma sedebokerense]|nr:Nup85 nucleoporin-domain-containing protein [Paraphysoderma sedebokerense]